VSESVKISKLDAARRQLETAIILYFHEGDPISIHTLAGAAYEVLRGLNKARGGPPMIKDWVADYIKPEFVNEIRTALNASQNFLKHADRDADAVLEYEPGQADFLLLDACWAYRRLAGEHLPLLGVFELRAAITWARRFVTYKGTETIAVSLSRRVGRPLSPRILRRRDSCCLRCGRP
jgi:hypothetical protein